MIKSEFIRLTADLNLWWYLASLALWLACWVIEGEIVRGILLSILIGMAILPLSHLGSEEQQTGVEEWLQTIPGALLRQAIVSGVTGILMVAFLILPVLIRSFSYGFPVVLVLFSFAVCLPLFALFLGTYTKIERPFQLILLVFLYLLLNDPEMCLPISGGSVAVMLLFYLVVAGISISAVIVKQKKQML